MSLGFLHGRFSSLGVPDIKPKVTKKSWKFIQDQNDGFRLLYGVLDWNSFIGVGEYHIGT